MAYDCKMICDSVSPAGVRLSTLEVTLPRIVLAEFNTHRMLSRNSASSRAIPVERRIQMIEEDPFVPAAFGKNQKGMQAGEDLAGEEEVRATLTWFKAMNAAVANAKELASLGVHKQLANRLLEPFAWHTIVTTATEWENFFALRRHANAQPEIRTAADMMHDVMLASTPWELELGDWHLPYLSDEERGGPYTSEPFGTTLTLETVIKISVARCARVSYLTHDGKRDHAADIMLYDRLVSSGHMSPLEHAARPLSEIDWLKVPGICTRYGGHWSGCFRGWVSRRAVTPGEAVFRG